MRLKEYTSAEVQNSKQLVVMNVNPLAGATVSVDPIEVEKFSPSIFTVKPNPALYRSRIYYTEVGRYIDRGKIVCPVEDVDEILETYKERMQAQIQQDIDKLEAKINFLKQLHM